jgi:hypothetical protein
MIIFVDKMFSVSLISTKNNHLIGYKQTIVQGGKKFQAANQHTFCLKITKKIPFFSKSLKNKLFFDRPSPARGAKDPFAPLRTPMDIRSAIRWKFATTRSRVNPSVKT